MKKRISQKKHKEFLSSVIYFASLSHDFRPRLLQNRQLKIEINKKTIAKTSDMWNCFNRWNLKYIVEVAPDMELTEFPYFTGCVLFKCYAQDFPSIAGYSGNNPNVLV